MKIRFYHWWIYSLFHHTWGKILAHPDHRAKVVGIYNHIGDWLERTK